MSLPDTSPRALVKTLPKAVREPAEIALDHIQHGCFQRSMALLVAGSSLVSTLEVGYEHYKGSYSNPVMYTPVMLRRSADDCVDGRDLQPSRGDDVDAMAELHHARRWRDRILLPHSRRRA